MPEMWIKKLRRFWLDLFFPKFCLNCRRPGNYLCPDCLALIEIANKVLPNTHFLSSLYFSTDYQNFLIKQMMQKFKYQPFAKELAKDLTLVIITYLENLEKQPLFIKNPQDYLLVPVPLHQRKLKRRGFNQAAEIAKILAAYYTLPFLENGLVKVKATIAQADLSEKQRKNNLRRVFVCPQPELVKDRKIILFDDIVTTGATMEEGARALKAAGASQVIGLCLAHA